MTDEDIAKLTIGTLKNVLFQNHVNATLMLEKSELVGKVMRLVEAERTERREREEEEERERLREEEEAMERQRVMMAQHRERQEREAREREEREKREREAQESTGGDEPPVVVEGEQTVDEEKPPATDERPSEETTPAAAPSTPPKPKTTAPPVPPKSPASMAAHLERTGLCVICQDEEANIAIVDCGYVQISLGSLIIAHLVYRTGISRCAEVVRTSSWGLRGNVPFVGLGSSQKLGYFGSSSLETASCLFAITIGQDCRVLKSCSP